MKKFTTLLSLFLLFSVSVFADDIAINEETFPDANFRAIVAASDIDKDLNGYLSEEEIAATKKLNVKEKSIADLKGIEYFTSIIELNCYGNQLPSLDVSKNTALMRLQCGKNQLTSLDVSKNTALEVLYCSNNQLTSLDVSKNTALEQLDCEKNQLTSLDVSKNTALKLLFFDNNQLTSIDVSKNPALEYVRCSNNQLTSLNMSNNTALKELSCPYNQLISLDLPDNTALEALYCGDNKLTSLDVSKNTALKNFHCCYNQLTSLDVSNNTALKELYCLNNKLTSLDVSKNTALKILYCQYNQLTSLVVSKDAPLTDLRYYNNQINETEMGKLVESLPIVSKGDLLVKILKAESDKNVITKAQVADAKEKGWTVYALEHATGGLVQVEYEGSDPSEPQGDIKKTTVDGVEWNYTIVSENDKTCMLGGSTTGDDGTVVYYPAIDVNTTGGITIPGILDGYTVVTIGKEAFRGCKISTVTIPAEVTYIDDNAFAECSLVKVTCNGQPYDISETAFEGLYSQATVYYPEDCGEEFQSKKGWSKFSKWYEQGVEEDYLNEFKEVIMHLRELLDVAHENLVKKATQSEAPELYNEYDYCSDEINYIVLYFERIIWEGCVTIQNAKDFRERLEYLHKSIYEFYQKVEQYQPIVKIAINEENFPDANFRAIVAASDIDKDQDGYLSEEEITATKKLSVDKKSIADLKGVEYFTSITNLYCTGNQLTSLDVSKNTALTSLYCNNNQLTALDVSKNLELNFLYCYSNALTALDVSQNTKLWFIHCGDNQISALDVTKNTALMTLYCHKNLLTSLDVSHNTSLGILSCGDNKINSLDLSNNISLNTLGCGGNQLISLDVSNNTSLTDLACWGNKLSTLDVTNLASLKTLSCGDNQLTLLDLSQNNSLVEILCEGNLLSSLDLKDNTNLDDLYCGNNNLTSLDVTNNARLVVLDCSGNQIKSKEMGDLVNSLPVVENGWFFAVDSIGEQNVCTKEHVSIANGKGWIVYEYIDENNVVEYEGSDPVNTTLDPINNDENINIGNEVNTDTNLDGNVVGNILYNISSGNGEFNPEEGCIVVSKPVSDETMSNLEGKDIFGEDFKDQYTGIVFKVAEGKGSVKVEAQTTGNMVLKVKIGNNDPIEMELDGKLKITFPYNVSEETLVYIYGSTKAAQAKRYAKGAKSAASGSLKIYGIEITRTGPSGIGDISTEDGLQDVYSLSGQKVRLQAKDLKGLPAGVYIVGGKKVVVK